MTLRNLAQHAGIDMADRAIEPDPRSALIFVLNRPFLVGLKTLAYSMIRQHTLLDQAVIILTDDATLADDEFVKAFSDKTIVVTDAQISLFKDIPSTRVDPRVRLDWIPAYTYLKWLIFDDFGFDQIIWIDADIICLGSLEELLLKRDAVIYGGGAFKQDLYLDAEKKKLPVATRARNILEFSASEAPGKSFNSGVMVINQEALNASFRERLIANAKAKEFTNEQTVISQTLAGMPNGRGFLAPWFNYSHAYTTLAGAGNFAKLIGQVRLLHYVGVDGKPWDRPKSTRITERLWWDMHQEAAETSPLFA